MAEILAHPYTVLFARLSVGLVFLTTSCRPTPAATALPGATAAPTPMSSAMPPTEPDRPSQTPLAPTSIPHKSLTLCTGSEPQTLYRYFGSMPVQEEILAAIAPDPVEIRDYEYYPTILEKIPALDDGDAVIEPAIAQEGDLIVDDSGEVVSLQPGVTYRPSGCRQTACAQTYQGGQVELDQITVSFRLLPDLKWSDGALLTAADSVFAFQIAEDLGVEEGLRSRTSDYSALDEQTVRWTGLPGYLSRFYFLTFFAPLPQHVLEKIRPAQYFELDGAIPVGWGPFMVEAWEPGREIRLVRNPHYYRAHEGLPLLDRVIVKPIGQNREGHGLAGVLTGQCDLADSELASSKALWIYRQLEETSELQVGVSWLHWDGLAFGIDSLAARPDFFGDVRVRQAIAYGTDRLAIVEAALGDASLAADNYVPASHPLYAEDGLALYPYSPERAGELLAEAGWRDTDGDGIVEKDGQPFVAQLLVAMKWQQRAPGLATLQQNMADIGIKVQVEFLKPEVYFAGGPQGSLAERKFDLVWNSWYVGPVDGSSQPSCTEFLTRAIPASAQD